MKALSEDGKTVTINKFEKLEPPSRKREAGDELVIIIDVETTGLAADHDRVIQLAMRPFYVDVSTGEVTGIAKKMVFYQDPGEPLREEIIKLTGITDADVAGETIDWSWVRDALHRASYIICHNASFDRSFVENELAKASLEFTDGPIWCCSMRQIDWHEVCRPSKALEVLCAWSGFFYDSHDASSDVDALLHLVRYNSKLGELLKRGATPEKRVFAVNSPRDLNHLLKRRWYRWDPSVYMWWRGFEDSSDADAECEWLKENIEGVEPQIFEVEPKHRYSPE